MRTKTQKNLTISKTKSENIFSFITKEVSPKILSEYMHFGKTKTFDLRKELNSTRHSYENSSNPSFDALAKHLTLEEINQIINLYNDYIQNPESYIKRRKTPEENIKKQHKVIKKHMDAMNLNYSKPNESDEKGV
ncbi:MULTISPECIES: hypothetical protein [Staphylococcus]|uniref:Uncharacterized protein n=1 Tax=Staphylococcus warneri TaxID=1292 RepID=A0AB36BLF7_STAWA|nr:MULTISPECIES: hypothetical protein [Staphylococcus]EAC3256968.1 hypothetical protein [Listeria monocytogenes]NBH31812.1 hypothetical protein [Staphylococcus warneri]